MNASLVEPDFLSCSIILTQPVQASRHKVRRTPQLTFAKQLIKDKLARTGPMAARRPKNNYAADQAVAKHPPHRFDPLPGAQGYPGIGPGAKQIPPQNLVQGQRGQLPPLQARLEPLLNNRMQPPKMPGQLGQANNKPDERPRPKLVPKRNSFPPFELEEMPEPPHWLTAYTTSQLFNLPLTDSDDAILGWFQSIENGIVKLGVRFHAMAPQEQKKKISNADRFRLKLPPVPPKKLVRPNKPAPFILPGMDYTEEEIEALGLQNYIKTHAEPEEEQEEIVTIHDTPSVFWGRLMRSAFSSTAKTVRKDVMDALWFLLDTLSKPIEDGKKHVTPPRPLRAKPDKKLEEQNQFLEKGDSKIKAAAKAEKQNAFLRPGQMAAQKAAEKGSDTVPKARDYRPQAPLRPKGNGGVFIKQGADKMPGAADGRLQAPGAIGDSDTQAKIALIDNILAKAEGKIPSKAQLNLFGDRATTPEEADDPYARERQRPGQPANVQAGELHEAETSEDGEENLSPDPSEMKIDEEDDSQSSSTDEDSEDSLLKLLAFKQRELADLRKQLLLEHKRKMSKPKSPGAGPGAKAKGPGNKPLQPLKATKQEKKAEDVLFPRLKDAGPPEALKAAKNVFLPQEDKQAKPKLVPLMPGKPAMKPLQALKAQNQPQNNENVFLAYDKKAAPVKALQAAKNAFLQPGGRQPKPKLVPLIPGVPRQPPKFEEEVSDVFEEHIRQAQKVKVKKLEEQVQPERLLEDLEENVFLRKPDDSPGHANNKLMMAGMVKARPAARE